MSKLPSEDAMSDARWRSWLKMNLENLGGRTQYTDSRKSGATYRHTPEAILDDMQKLLKRAKEKKPVSI